MSQLFHPRAGFSCHEWNAGADHAETHGSRETRAVANQVRVSDEMGIFVRFVVTVPATNRFATDNPDGNLSYRKSCGAGTA